MVTWIAFKYALFAVCGFITFLAGILSFLKPSHQWESLIKGPWQIYTALGLWYLLSWYLFYTDSRYFIDFPFFFYTVVGRCVYEEKTFLLFYSFLIGWFSLCLGYLFGVPNNWYMPLFAYTTIVTPFMFSFITAVSEEIIKRYGNNLE